jgi:hypothetical protein
MEPLLHAGDLSLRLFAWHRPDHFGARRLPCRSRLPSTSSKPIAPATNRAMRTSRRLTLEEMVASFVFSVLTPKNWAS